MSLFAWSDLILHVSPDLYAMLGSDCDNGDVVAGEGLGEVLDLTIGVAAVGRPLPENVQIRHQLHTSEFGIWRASQGKGQQSGTNSIKNISSLVKLLAD